MPFLILGIFLLLVHYLSKLILLGLEEPDKTDRTLSICYSIIILSAVGVFILKILTLTHK